MVGFRSNTKVLMSDNTYKNIQDIQVGEYVMSYDEDSGQLVPQIVVDVTSDICDELTVYTFDNGDILYGCEELVFLTNDGWKENIDIGDLIITKNGTTTALLNEEIIGQETVYELDIEDIDDYIVENIVVHNAIYTWTWNVAIQHSSSSGFADTIYIWSSTIQSGTYTYTSKYAARGGTASSVYSLTAKSDGSGNSDIYLRFSPSNGSLGALTIDSFSFTPPTDMNYTCDLMSDNKTLHVYDQGGLLPTSNKRSSNAISCVINATAPTPVKTLQIYNDAGTSVNTTWKSYDNNSITLSLGPVSATNPRLKLTGFGSGETLGTSDIGLRDTQSSTVLQYSDGSTIIWNSNLSLYKCTTQGASLYALDPSRLTNWNGTYLWASSTINGTKTYVNVFSSGSTITSGLKTWPGGSYMYVWLSLSDTTYTAPVRYKFDPFYTRAGTLLIPTADCTGGAILVSDTGSSSNKINYGWVAHVTHILSQSGILTKPSYLYTNYTNSTTGAVYVGAIPSGYDTLEVYGDTTVYCFLSDSNVAYHEDPYHKIVYINNGTILTDTSFSMSFDASQDTSTQLDNRIIALNEKVSLPLYVGTSEVKKICVGSTEASAMYIGSNKIF